jgi:hypothetical protein
MYSRHETVYIYNILLLKLEAEWLSYKIQNF